MVVNEFRVKNNAPIKAICDSDKKATTLMITNMNTNIDVDISEGVSCVSFEADEIVICGDIPFRTVELISKFIKAV